MGDGSDLQALEEEVRAMEARVKRMRSEGRASFRSLLQENLAKRRPLPTLEPLQHNPYLDGVNGDVLAIQARQAEALRELPRLLERVTKRTEVLASAMALLRHKRSYDALFELPQQPAPEEDLDLASRFFPT